MGWGLFEDGDMLWVLREKTESREWSDAAHPYGYPH